MLRTNLATRPFYNERAVQLVLGLVALIVLALTVFNIYRIVTLSRRNTELAASIGRDQGEAERLRREAQRIRSGMDQTELRTIAANAQEANALIDRRTFSWTEFFNQIEATIPADVMLTAVQPNFDRGVTTVNMMMVGRRAEDVDDFMERLDASGAFEQVLPTQADRTEEGWHRVVVTSTYIGPSANAGQAVTPAAAEPAAPPPGGGRGR